MHKPKTTEVTNADSLNDKHEDFHSGMHAEIFDLSKEKNVDSLGADFVKSEQDDEGSSKKTKSSGKKKQNISKRSTKLRGTAHGKVDDDDVFRLVFTLSNLYTQIDINTVNC